jgi:predicted metal-dependent phosphoesterase TrpH
MIKIDFHTHTFFSYDCVMQPAKILKTAAARGITHLVVNDHNTIQGGLACKALEKDFSVEVIIGSELKTDIGDVTGIFLKEEIKPGPYLEVVAEIKKQGGLIILNHPFVGHHLSEVNFSVFDFIEGYNGRCDEKQNALAVKLASENNKPVVAGSDAHTYAEVGRSFSEFESLQDLSKPVAHNFHKTHNFFKVYSQLIKALKKNDVGLFGKVLLSAPKKIILNR